MHFFSKNSLDLRVKTTDKGLDCPLTRWLTDRYCLFTAKGSKVFRGDVLHEPWDLKQCSIIDFKDEFSSQFSFSSEDKKLHLAYAKGLDVRFKPFRQV